MFKKIIICQAEPCLWWTRNDCYQVPPQKARYKLMKNNCSKRQNDNHGERSRRDQVNLPSRTAGVCTKAGLISAGGADNPAGATAGPGET